MGKKNEIAKELASKMNMPETLANRVVQEVLDEIIELLARDRRLELRNFGVFKLRVRAPRQARNPRTNEGLHVPARTTVTFKAGREMSKRIAMPAVDGRAAAVHLVQPATKRSVSVEMLAGPDPKATRLRLYKERYRASPE